MRWLAHIGVLLATLLGAGGCHKDKRPAPEAPNPSVRDAYDGTVLRLSAGFTENGWVVSRDEAGRPVHIGDSLLWTGLWLAAAPCDVGEESNQALRRMVSGRGGGLVRYESVGGTDPGTIPPASLDGALGLYRGLAERVVRCAGTWEWEDFLRLHFDYLVAHDDKFDEKGDAYLTEEFGYVLQALGSKMGIAAAPADNDIRKLETLVTGWAAVVNATHAAAYRVHLGLVALQTVERLGFRVEWGGFCAATRGVDIPTVDHQCGRGDLKAWIDGFQFNRWEYRHQRSGSWETPDGNGFHTPGLDLIVAIRDAYELD